MVLREHRGNEADWVEQREAVHDAEYVASEERSDAGRPAITGNDVYAGDPFAWSASAHRYFEDGVIETVDRSWRRENQGEPDRVGIERLSQAPRAVIGHCRDDEPRNREKRPNEP